MKRLMLLGASKYLEPVVKCAKKLGIYTISCDDNPDHIGHKFTDEYVIADLIDKDAVLKAAQELKIDGILSFACDCGVTTAAYVADRMGLPMTGPYESVCILQNKGRFRQFLKDNGFNVPNAGSYSSYEDAVKAIDEFRMPIIVKPVDSAGSKGVTRVDSLSDLADAVKLALDYSFCGDFIVEEFIEKAGCSSDSDCFSVDGELRVCSFSDQLFDASSDNIYAPAGYIWPSSIESKYQDELRNEIQRLLRLLNMNNSQYNVECRVGTDGKAYLMEVTPRAGGNRIAEMIHFASDVDMIEYSVKSAVGMETGEIPALEYRGFWAEVILHSNEAGCYRGISVVPEIEDCVVEIDEWVKKGDRVNGFSAANQSIGTLVLNFKDDATRQKVMNNSNDYIKVVLE